MDHPPCRACGASSAHATPILLWDNHHYCLPCVDRASPILADYALHHPILKDTLTIDPALIQRRFRATISTVAILSALAAIVGILLGPTEVLFLGFIVGLALFTTAATYLGLSSFNRDLARLAPVVQIENGLVTVFRPLGPGKPLEPCVSYPLAEATWRLGRLTDDAMLDSSFRQLPPTPAIVLYAPIRSAKLSHPGRRAAIGSTPEMLALWTAFLTLASIPPGPTLPQRLLG